MIEQIAVNRDEFVADLQKLIRIYILKFFRGKSYFCGGPIPQNTLLSQPNVNLVISTPFGLGIQECHQHADHLLMPMNFDESEDGEWEIYFVNELRQEVSHSGVPKEFQAGMMLLYLKLCKGRQVSNRAFSITHLVGTDD